MKKIVLIGLVFFFSVISAELGIDYNAEGNYYDLYNDFHHYYIDAETGIDLTNDYYDFWSKKEFCLEIKSKNLQGKKCSSEIPLTWSTEENEFYVKLIGELDYLSNIADFNLVYFLGLNDERITVTPQAKTKNKSLDYLKFSVKDYNIRVKRDYENDYLRIDYPYYEEYSIEDGDYTEYYNIVDNYYNLFDDNGSGRQNIEFWWDNQYYLNGEYLLWQDENLTAAFNLTREKDFVNIELTSGEIPKNSNFETNFYWVDAGCTVLLILIESIPSVYEGEQSNIACTWSFSGSNCPDEVRWETNEGIGGQWITLPVNPDKNSFGLNCGATGGEQKAQNVLSKYSLASVNCNANISGSGSETDYIECGADANISNHLARCALYQRGAFKAASTAKTAVCKEKVLLGFNWTNPSSDYTEHAIDKNIIIEAKTTCTDGFCGDSNSFLQWCEREYCIDWKDVNSSSGNILLIQGNNPISGFDLNETQYYDLNWIIQIKKPETFELRLKALGEFTPEATTNGANRTIYSGNPPITSVDVNSFWQNFDANLHFSCLDENESGCNKTYYRIDLNGLKDTNYGNWQEYDSNVLVSQDGNIGIQFYSVDLGGNTESTKETFALIDKTTHYLLTENFLPNPSNATKNFIKLTDGNYTLSYCYYSGSNQGDAYFIKSFDALNWGSAIQINSDAGYCSGYYSENGSQPYRTGEGGITSTVNSLNDLFFLFSEWNGIKTWTKILYSNQTWSDTTLINDDAGNSPNKDTLNIVTDSNDSINYIITQKST